MRRLIFLVLILLVGILVFSQVSVKISPQILPPGAPFRIVIESDLTGITSIVATFDGISLTRSKVPAFFTFYAPKLLNGHEKDVTVHITVFTKYGDYSKSVVVRVSNNANPVIVMEPPMPSNGNYIKGTVEIPVEVYGGIGLTKIQFMVDSHVASSISVNSSKLLGVFKRIFRVNTATLSNTWHTFSVKVVNVTGQIFSKIKAYIVNNLPPFVEIQKFGTCLAAGTPVTIKVTAMSTVSDITEVKIDGVIANRISKTVWEAQLPMPKRTGDLTIHATVTDKAGNKAGTNVSVFVDGRKPSIKLSSDAKIMDKVDGKIILWKRNSPLTLTVTATAASEHCGIKPSVRVKILNSRGTVVSTSTAIKLVTPGAYVIFATAVDQVNKLSSSIDEKYTVKFDDKAPMIKKFIILPNKFRNKDGYTVVGPNSTITVKVTANDENGVGIETLRLSTMKLTRESTNTWAFTLPQLHPGPNELHLNLVVEDRLGNSKTTSKTAKIFLDAHPPVVKYAIPADAVYKDGTYWEKVSPFRINVKITTGSGIKPKYEIIVNGVENPSSSICIKSAGMFKVTVVATNPANGEGTSYTKTFNVKFDNKPPIIKSIKLLPNKFKNDDRIIIGPDATLIVKVAATDETGVGIMNVSINNKRAKKVGNEYVAAFKSPSGKMSGKWPVKIVVNDYLGNSVSVAKTVFVDVKPPSIMCKLIPSEYYRHNIYWKKKPPFILLVEAKTDSGMKALVASKLNGKPFNEATLVNIAGTYTLTVVATNPVNDLSATSKKIWTLRFDRTPPEISNVTVPATVGTDQKIIVKAVVTDKGIGVKKYGVWVNDKLMNRVYGNMYSATLTTPSPSTSGYWLIKIHAIDVFGNSSSTSVKVFIDVNPPLINLYLNNKKIENGFDGIFYSKKAALMRYVAITDGGITPKTKMYLDCGKETQDSVKISGTHFVTVISTNPVNGKSAKLRAKFTVVVDNIKPVVKIITPDKISATSTAQIRVSVEDRYLKYALLIVKSQDNSLLYVKVYGQSTTTTVDLRRALSGINGQNVTIYMIAEDLAGNISQFGPKNVYVDTVPPYIENVEINKAGDIVVTFSEEIKGRPMVEIYLDGKKILEKEGIISGKTITVYNVSKKLPNYTIYKVEIRNVTDKVGNAIGNNSSSWEF